MGRPFKNGMNHFNGKSKDIAALKAGFRYHFHLYGHSGAAPLRERRRFASAAVNLNDPKRELSPIQQNMIQEIGKCPERPYDCLYNKLLFGRVKDRRAGCLYG